MILVKYLTTLINSKSDIHTDHLNVTNDKITPHYAVHLLNCVKQFNPCIRFIPGSNNFVADTLSHLDRLNEFILSKGK